LENLLRILFVNAVNSDLAVRQRQEVLRQSARPGTQVDVTYLSQPEEPALPFLPALPTYHGALFRRIVQAEQEGYDGVIVGCSADPGVLEAKRMVSIPVTGPLEANLHLAAMLRARVTILLPAGVEARTRYWDLARAYGLEHKIASIVSVDLHYPPQEECIRMMHEEPQRLLDLILEDHKEQLVGPIADQARRAIVEDGAQAIFLGCTYWTGMAGILAQALDSVSDPLDDRFAATLRVPVLDPGVDTLRVMEALACAAKATRDGYPRVQ
jgi:allantoin racemase